MKLINLIIVFLALLLTQSCFNSNGIYFDLKTQEIKSCSNNGIRSIYIDNDSTADNYKIEWQNDQRNPPTVIALNKVAEGYLITKSWKRTIINPSDFKLNANSKYKIERNISDVSGIQIEIITNNLSQVVKTSKSECNK